MRTPETIRPGAAATASGASETALVGRLSHALNTSLGGDATGYAAGWVARNYHLAPRFAEIVAAAAMLGGQL